MVDTSTFYFGIPRRVRGKPVGSPLCYREFGVGDMRVRFVPSKKVWTSQPDADGIAHQVERPSLEEIPLQPEEEGGHKKTASIDLRCQYCGRLLKSERGKMLHERACSSKPLEDGDIPVSEEA